MLIVMSCTTNESSAKNEKSYPYKLSVTYGYGERTEVIATTTTLELLHKTIGKLNWKQFHIITLQGENGNLIEGSGNTVDDGLSVTYKINGEEFITENAPNNISEIQTMLTSFLMDDLSFTKQFKFTKVKSARSRDDDYYGR